MVLCRLMMTTKCAKMAPLRRMASTPITYRFLTIIQKAADSVYGLSRLFMSYDALFDLCRLAHAVAQVI